MENELIRKSDAVRIVLHYEGQAAVAAMQDLNPVDAAPVVHSEWIDGKVIDVGGVKHKLSRTCKHCGKPSYDEPWQYCPRCDAIMDTKSCEQSVL